MIQKHKQIIPPAILTASLLLTLALIVHTVLLGGNVGSQSAQEGGVFRLGSRFDDFIARKSAVCMGQAEEPPTVYKLSDTDLVAPKPRQENYGTFGTAREMAPILEAASGLLDGQTMYFSTETELMPDTQIHYYLDESIFAVTWKEAHEGIAFTYSEVKIAHPTQFRRFLSGGKYASGVQTLCSEMAASVNAVVAINGDFYAYRHSGTNVYNGKVYRHDESGLHTCHIDEKGDLRFVYGGEMNSKDAVQAYVDENNIRFCLCFGPVMVDNGDLQKVSNYYLGEVNEDFSRAAICQMDTLHYLLVTANYEGRQFFLPTMSKFARIVHATGCQKAYALDGGQSATLIMNNAVINQVSYDNERKQSDIIYFATAVP